MRTKFEKWFKALIIALAILMIVIALTPMCGDDVRQDALIAKEMQVIAEVKSGIDILHQRCLVGRSFIVKINEYQSIGYKCQGKYPLKLSLDKKFHLTNDATMENGSPLGLVTLSLEYTGWKTEELKDGRVKIKGAASSHDSGYEGDEIDANDYWIYDPQDGSVNFYNDGKFQKNGPLG